MVELQDRVGTLFKEIKPSYCIALSESGTRTQRSSHLEDFFPLIEQASIAWVDIRVEDLQKEAVEITTKFGFSQEIVKRLLTRSTEGLRFQGGYEDLDSEMGLLFPAIRVKGFDVTIYPLIILLKKGFILTIRNYEAHIFHNLHRYAETFLGRLPQNLQVIDWITLLLIRIIDENNERNFDQLQIMDEGSEDLTHHLKSDNVPRSIVGDQIYEMKRTLVKYLSGLWETLDTLNSLRYGDANLISDVTQVIDKIGILAREVRDQLSLGEHLSEVLASGLECLQSIYNNQLQDKNNQLQDLNNQLQEKNNILQEYNNQLQDKNNQLQDLNNQLQRKSNQLQDYNNKLQVGNNRLTLANNRLTSLNNRITLLGGWLAIIAAGFVVPNTIATVLSQTNIFQFTPEHMGWYLSLIVVSTIIATLFVWYLMRNRGLLPKKQEQDEDTMAAEREEREARALVDAEKESVIAT